MCLALAKAFGWPLGTATTDLAIPARVRPGFLAHQEATRVDEEDLCSEMVAWPPV